ncbi:protein fuzzy homolog isoform X3 [Canis lupus baileyi]|uniref:protein fuzzy homolog isoform X3 n=1 Tax=Canis lupus familiaris TaxID=9615 RepID=UPI0003AE085B|nr:protein fuzzy homolog isoform X3 [Canis lupus familiaris]XP_035567340.1 protein fuzzy homolog isoform X3 [Canis lupus dingo]XP_038384118.1 protein fuzzy homolog isoform X3 [Canis lupus familiaris]XP_038512204.1 protein fuzzy homolog isoform X3 [Canis lupus familiaris]XP_055166727.1 protein fuzzy homolog isoform X3 [Nyctereutes procyonoides]|eukprot:XP_005616349.1 protein fuzzy homolog isoform X3 [Canis lupus familiaris]
MGEEGTEGTVHLLCLAASSGVPLFCRSSRGGAPARQQLPFSVIGSLNGVHMFGQNLEVQLSSARTEDTTVVWKSFHDSITLIVLSSEEGTSELRLERLLQMVFGAMASYRLIDSFLGDSELIGDLTQCVDCVVPPEGSLLQEALAGFTEAVGTAFGCLVVSGRVVAATESWWRLGTPEAVLLPWLVGSLPPQAARDYPVYLPHGSPTVPHRLLTLTLLPGLELCLLCGPRPPLSQLDPQLLDRWWQPVLDLLRACVPLGPRTLPAGFPLHVDILGLLLLHLELKRCLFTVEPSGDQEPSPEQRRRLLRSFYTLVTATHFPPEPGAPEEKVEDAVQRTQVPRACYLVSGPEEPGTGWRLVALQLGPRRLLLLLSPQSPTHGLRGLATHTLHALTPLL